MIAVGFIAMLGLNSYLTRISAQFKQYMQALNFAQDKLDVLRGYSVLSTTSGKFAYADIATTTIDPSPPTSAPGDNTTYTRTWTVTLHSNPNYKIVNMKVSWVYASNTTQTIELVTIISPINLTYVGQTMAAK